jgi:hypothetical protein
VLLVSGGEAILPGMRERTGLLRLAGRREAVLSAGLVFLAALVVRLWAATQITFPAPEDTA